MENQAYIFLIFILNGFLIGIIFDAFRILRKSFKTKDFVTIIEDIIFWIISGFIIFYSVFKFNNGEVRGYIFLGILFGAIIYLLAFSKIFINVSVSVINIIKRIFNYAIIKPIKFLIKMFKKIIFKPISFVIINFRKIMSKAKDLPKKLRKNIKIKKDLI